MIRHRSAKRSSPDYQTEDNSTAGSQLSRTEILRNRFKDRTPAALCSSELNQDPEMWFLSKSKLKKKPDPLLVCRECPIKAACARMALDTDFELSGIWAGKHFDSKNQDKTELEAIAQRDVNSDIDAFISRVTSPDFKPQHSAIPRSMVHAVLTLNQDS